MAKFTVPTFTTMDTKTIGRLLSGIRDSVEKWDLDDGWETATGTKTHRLGIAPGWVVIQASDDPKGDPYEQIHPTSVSSTAITYTTAKAYVRVLAEK